MLRTTFRVLGIETKFIDSRWESVDICDYDAQLPWQPISKNAVRHSLWKSLAQGVTKTEFWFLFWAMKRAKKSAIFCTRSTYLPRISNLVLGLWYGSATKPKECGTRGFLFFWKCQIPRVMDNAQHDYKNYVRVVFSFRKDIARSNLNIITATFRVLYPTVCLATLWTITHLSVIKRQSWGENFVSYLSASSKPNLSAVVSIISKNPTLRSWLLSPTSCISPSKARSPPTLDMRPTYERSTV